MIRKQKNFRIVGLLFFVAIFGRLTMLLTIMTNFLGLGIIQGRSQGEWGKSPPPKPKNGGVISEGSIFSNKFSKKNKKIQFFYRIFIQKFQNFPTICVFRPNAQKVNAWFVN